MMHGRIMGELGMLKSAALAATDHAATRTPERKAQRDRAEYLHELIAAMNEAEAF